MAHDKEIQKKNQGFNPAADYYLRKKKKKQNRKEPDNQNSVLQVNPPDDVYEKEADQNADKFTQKPVVQAMTAAEVQTETQEKEGKTTEKLPDHALQTQSESAKAIQPFAQLHSENTQTKSEDKSVQPFAQMMAENAKTQTKPEEPKTQTKPEEPKTQTKSSDNQDELIWDAQLNKRLAGADIKQKIEDTKGKGQNLPNFLQKMMSKFFGYDFSNVIIHTDSDSIALNRSLKARAFTQGADIYFNQNLYKPDTQEGMRLLVHELSHTIHQKAVLPASSTEQIKSKTLEINQKDKTSSGKKVNDFSKTAAPPPEDSQRRWITKQPKEDWASKLKQINTLLWEEEQTQDSKLEMSFPPFDPEDDE